jgi:signal transduction protein with GAF and PtsI domain
MQQSIPQQNFLKSLLEVAEILSRELQMEILVQKTMSRTCELLKADRCSLFMVNDTHEKLISSFAGGLSTAIEIPISAGIVGYITATGEIFNIRDAYDDPQINHATDLSTGYRTISLLYILIINSEQAVMDLGGSERGTTNTWIRIWQ